MPKFIDRTGKVFERLTVIRRAANSGGHAGWLCRCICGAEVEVAGNNLVNKSILSCGCLRREQMAIIRIKSVIKMTTHGASRRGKATPEFSSWKAAKARCFNPNNNNFYLYGGRGVTMCEEWRHDFATFLAHVGVKPSPELTLDRIDPNGNYEPGNVRWATRLEQSRNRRPRRRKQP